MSVLSWQRRLLPFLVIAISVLAVCFIAFYFKHISDVEKALENIPVFESSSQTDGDYNLNRWNDLRDLERFSIENRYYNARLIIRSRLLMISLSFLTGVVLCLVGSIFILGKFSEEPSVLESSQEKINFKLVSSSPGIILSSLGIFVICVSILSKVELNVADTPLFMPASPEDVSQGQQLDSEHDVDSSKKKILDGMIRDHDYKK